MSFSFWFAIAVEDQNSSANQNTFFLPYCVLKEYLIIWFSEKNLQWKKMGPFLIYPVLLKQRVCSTFKLYGHIYFHCKVPRCVSGFCSFFFKTKEVNIPFDF